MAGASGARIDRGLGGHPWDRSSPPTGEYNCLAWAAGEDHRWWWPAHGGYWPPGIEATTEPTNLVRAYEAVGFSLCDGADPDPGREKIALLERDGAFTHACRIREDGLWWSKLGADADVTHDRAGIEACYGRVFAFMSRPKRSA